MKKSFQDLFMVGANQLAAMGIEWGPDQQAAGFSETEWLLLTDTRCWSRSDQQKIPSALRKAVSLTLNIAGLTPTPLPAQFVAAVICKLCAPCNCLVASRCAPESFDAMAASGIYAETEVIASTVQQMDSLICAFQSGDYSSIQSARVDEIAENAAVDGQE